jgi:ParB family chromosome partitioning protein
MAKTKSAAEPDIVAEAEHEQSTINLDAPQETPAPAPDLTEAETAAHEGEAALFEMGEHLPDPGSIDATIPDVLDNVIPFENISDVAPKVQPAEQEPPEQKAPAPEQTPEEQPTKEEEAPEPEKHAKRGKASKADKAEKPVKAAKADKATEKQPKPEKPPKAAENAAPVQEAAPIVPPEPKEAPRAGEQEQIVYLNLSELFAFKDHPFQVKDDEEMRAMVESVKDKGVTQPAIVRPREDGGYEMVSGHRRMKASELAGFANMPCIVRNLTDEQAITQMVEDNTNQRENILPSERAKALKMQLEAIKRQGARGDLGTSGQDGPKLENGQRSNQIVAERNKMAVKQVQRYIKLNDLVPDLMKLVDEKKIAFTPAVEMSYIRPKNQRYIAVAIEGQQSAPSLSQAQRMRELDQKNMLNGDVIDGIMLEEKKEVDKVIISSQELGQYFGKEKTPREMKDQILKLLDEWKEKQPQDWAKAEKKTEQEK